MVSGNEVNTICMVSGQNNIIQDQSHRAIRNHNIIVLPLFVYLLTSGTGTAHPSGAPEFTSGFSGVRVTRSLVSYVCFVDSCLSFCIFSFGQEAIRIRISKKKRRHNGQKKKYKRTNNDQQNIYRLKFTAVINQR